MALTHTCSEDNGVYRRRRGYGKTTRSRQREGGGKAIRKAVIVSIKIDPDGEMSEKGKTLIGVDKD